MSKELNVKLDNVHINDGKELVIIDCDAGNDDALALLLALNSKFASHIHVLGITCVGGNTTLDNVVKNVLRVLKVSGREEVPVFKGATMGMAPRDFLRVASHIHGNDGIGGVSGTMPVSDAQLEEVMRRENAVDWMGRTITRYPPGTITLITLGPVTNVAFAHRLFPLMHTNLKKLVVMGGTLNAKGNSGLTSEFNFDCDPEAAWCLLEEFKCPITVMPFDSCLSHPFSYDYYEKVLAESNSIKSKFVHAIFRAKNEYTKKTFPDLGGFYACDWLAMICALFPNAIKERVHHYAKIELGGQMTRGQMVVDWRNAFPEKKKLEIIVQLDMEEVKKIFKETVA